MQEERIKDTWRTTMTQKYEQERPYRSDKQEEPNLYEAEKDYGEEKGTPAIREKEAITP